MWDKIERNEDGTYTISGLTGKSRTTLTDLINSKEISKEELLDLIEKMPVNKEISIIEFVLIDQLL